MLICCLAVFIPPLQVFHLLEGIPKTPLCKQGSALCSGHAALEMCYPKKALGCCFVCSPPFPFPQIYDSAIIWDLSPDCCLQGTGHVSAIPGLDGVNDPSGLENNHKSFVINLGATACSISASVISFCCALWNWPGEGWRVQANP